MDAAKNPSLSDPARAKSALAFFGVLLLIFLPGLLAQAVQRSIGLAWTEVFAFLVPALVATAGSNLRPIRFLRLSAPRASLVALGGLVGAAGYLFAGAVMAAAERLLPQEWVSAFDVTAVFDAPRWERAALFALATLVAPACEEIAFRGYVLTALAQRHRPAAAISGAALLFALMHLDPVRFPPLLLLGAVFGWLAWRAGSVWPAVAAHAANNAIASALVLAAGPRAKAVPPWSAVVGSLALGAAALAMLLAGYRAATPRPPAPGEAIELRDPADPSLRFSWERVPTRLRTAALAGLALLLPLAVFAMLLAASPRPPAPPAGASAGTPAADRGGR